MTELARKILPATHEIRIAGGRKPVAKEKKFCIVDVPIPKEARTDLRPLSVLTITHGFEPKQKDENSEEEQDEHNDPNECSNKPEDISRDIAVYLKIAEERKGEFLDGGIFRQAGAEILRSLQWRQKISQDAYYDFPALIAAAKEIETTAASVRKAATVERHVSNIDERTKNASDSATDSRQAAEATVLAITEVTRDLNAIWSRTNRLASEYETHAARTNMGDDFYVRRHQETLDDIYRNVIAPLLSSALRPALALGPLDPNHPTENDELHQKWEEQLESFRPVVRKYLDFIVSQNELTLDQVTTVDAHDPTQSMGVLMPNETIRVEISDKEMITFLRYGAGVIVDGRNRKLTLAAANAGMERFKSIAQTSTNLGSVATNLVKTMDSKVIDESAREAAAKTRLDMLEMQQRRLLRQADQTLGNVIPLMEAVLLRVEFTENRAIELLRAPDVESQTIDMQQARHYSKEIAEQLLSGPFNFHSEKPQSFWTTRETPVYNIDNWDAVRTLPVATKVTAQEAINAGVNRVLLIGGSNGMREAVLTEDMSDMPVADPKKDPRLLASQILEARQQFLNLAKEIVGYGHAELLQAAAAAQEIITEYSDQPILRKPSEKQLYSKLQNGAQTRSIASGAPPQRKGRLGSLFRK